ncbi:MAG: hypothetical protein M0P30_01865 [Syntrophorhabdaceae bacterium]|nr:hypothetical protein [Syntrophorhabdaceae bacterium]
MADIYDISHPSVISEINNNFPLLKQEDFPKSYDLTYCGYKTKEIETYSAIFWHRLMKKIYGEPSETDFRVFVKKKDGTITILQHQRSEEDNLLCIDDNVSKFKRIDLICWRYFIGLPSGGFIIAGTNKSLEFYIGYGHSQGKSLTFEENKEGKFFIDCLLKEAKRVSSQIFNPNKEFLEMKGRKAYILTNLYLVNYRRALAIQILGESWENLFLNAIDGLPDDILNFTATAVNQYDKITAMKGMSYVSSIIYFFTALEGFINIIFHAFLKKEFRSRELNLEQRLDLEQKLLFMPLLCDHFRKLDTGIIDHILLEQFRKLKKYRNILVHAKIEDAFKMYFFEEDGFPYPYKVTERDAFIPCDTLKLCIDDVSVAKEVVDNIIRVVLAAMDDKTKVFIEELQEVSSIFFSISDDGSIILPEKKRDWSFLDLMRNS